MADIVEYISWRGDLSLKQFPLNEVDSLILCQISYCNFDGLLDSSFTKKGITLRELGFKFANSPDSEMRMDYGALINPLTNNLLQAASESKRFGDIHVCGYVNIIDTQKDEQFSAMTFCLPDNSIFVAYRGTDDTIVGWQEDFDLGWKDKVPAQVDAADYLEKAASSLKGKIYTGGHSKGANLVLYAAANATDKVKKRISRIFANDGPGFKKVFFESSGYLDIRSKVSSFKPQLSVVGMLFDCDENYVCVECDGKGLHQHDPFNWHVQADSFVETDQDEESRLISKAVNGWFNDLNLEQKRLFVQTVFGVLEDSDTSTNSDLLANWKVTVPKMIRAMQDLDDATRDAVSKSLQLLFKSGFDTVKESVKDKIVSKFDEMISSLAKD